MAGEPILLRDRPPDSDMSWIQTPGARGGIHDNDPEHRIEVYFAVLDIEAAIARVRQAGAHADDPGPEADGFGRFAACRDDQGVRFGLHQPVDSVAIIAKYHGQDLAGPWWQRA